jgi:hypothetical protein
MNDIDIRDTMQCIKGKEVYFLKLAFCTKDYDIIICFILFLGFIGNDFWKPEVIEFINTEIGKDPKLKELLVEYRKCNLKKIDELNDKVGIKMWIKNIVITERDKKINSILNDQS